ncbi:VOC family protein [Streptosporangium sp. V21-05]|uniref:VOC family protein n=1 Tax=Streptosporangium sp. V21-05 TaxID=3446115 RepID=UPI003F530239
MEIQITFDANDPPSLAAFWAEALGYRLQPPPEGFDSWEAWEEARASPRRGVPAGRPSWTRPRGGPASTSSACPRARSPRTASTWTST